MTDEHNAQVEPNVRVTDEMVDAYKAVYSKRVADWLEGNKGFPGNDFLREATRAGIEAALSSAPVPPVSDGKVEPVAWDCVAPDGGRYIIRAEGDQEPTGWQSFTPLYASPPARHSDEEVERLRDALEPFSGVAGELFAQNYNDGDEVLRVKAKTKEGNKIEYSVTFKAFRLARAALQRDAQGGGK